MFSAQQAPSSIPFPILIIDQNLYIIEENVELCNLLKTENHYLINKKLFDIFKPFSQSTYPVSLSDFNNNTDIYVHSNLSAYSNKSDTFRLIVHPQKNSNIAWVIISKERNWQQAYYEADKNLARLSNTIEASNTGIWRYNILTEQSNFSLKFKGLIGIDVNLPFTWSEFTQKILLEDQMIFNSFLKNHLDALIPLNVEFRMLIKNQIKWFTLQGDTFFDENQPTIIMGTLVDSSNTKAILSELNNAIESKNIAMEVGKIGTWRAELNNEHKWIWNWDKLTNQMFAIQSADIGQLTKLTDIIHPADKQRVLHALEVSLTTGKLFAQSYRVILPSGEIRYFIAKARIGQDTLGKNYRIDGIFVDETLIQNAQIELKNSNSELEKRVSARTTELVDSKERAEKASQIKTDFLAMMSHELRTPMNAVIGSLDLLQSTKQDIEAKELIDTAKTSAENLVFILNDILDINKIEAGKLEIEDLTFSIAEIIDNVVKIYIPVANKKNITLNIIEDPEAPLYVKGDAIRVRQILFNLVGNALKFTPSTIKKPGIVCIEVSEIEKNDFVSSISFKIIDNGIGIDKSTKETLFQPFIQAERSTTRKYGGTGLGLAICNKLSEMMGGCITLTSEPNVGSTFDVDIPFWKSQETRAMVIMELDDIEISMVSFENIHHKKVANCYEHIKKAGAHISLFETNILDNVPVTTNILFIIVNNLKQDEIPLKNLLSKNNNNKNVLIAGHAQENEKIKSDYKKIKVVDINQLTRNELINCILQVKQQTLDYDFEFDELELELELISPIEDEFALDLDLTKLTAAPPSHKTKEESLKEGVLVVEDNELNQKLITKQLKNIGYHCDVASDGREGQEKWQIGCYKVILTDCHMPIIDGYEMTKNIRQLEGEHSPKIPIIAITGAAMSGDAEHCYQVGMNDFVSKPIQQNDLKSILSKWYPNE